MENTVIEKSNNSEPVEMEDEDTANRVKEATSFRETQAIQ